MQHMVLNLPRWRARIIMRFVPWVWGWNFVMFLRLKRRTRSRVRGARFYSNGSLPKPRTYMDSLSNLLLRESNVYMGMVLEPSCSSCKHVWPTCSIGNANTFIAICVDCGNVVNAKRDGFRRSLKPCPNCGSDLAFGDMLDVFNAKPSKMFRCPRCNDDALSFRTVMHFSLAEFPTPGIGEYVHASYDNGDLEVPGLWLCSTDVKCHGIPAGNETRTMELKTIRKEMRDGSLEEIEFEFVRFVD